MYKVLGQDKDDRASVMHQNFNYLDPDDVVLNWDESRPVKWYGLSGHDT